MIHGMNRRRFVQVSALEAMGWMVREIPGADTAAILDPAVMVPEIRGFLEDAQ